MYVQGAVLGVYADREEDYVELAEYMGQIMLDYGALATAQVAYDTLPNPAANAPLAPELDWDAYIARRRTLLREKWRPAAIITLGTAPDWDAP